MHWIDNKGTLKWSPVYYSVMQTPLKTIPLGLPSACVIIVACTVSVYCTSSVDVRVVCSDAFLSRRTTTLSKAYKSAKTHVHNVSVPRHLDL